MFQRHWLGFIKHIPLPSHDVEEGEASMSQNIEYSILLLSRSFGPCLDPHVASRHCAVALLHAGVDRREVEKRS